MSSPWRLLALVVLAGGCSPVATDLSGLHFPCVTDGDCAADFQCRGSECVRSTSAGIALDGGLESSPPDAGASLPPDSGTPAPFADGTACSVSGQCSSTHCVDGHCCNSACGGSCESCNQASSQGTCKPLPVGRQGSPSCGPFVCDGASSSCPTRCTSSQQCLLQSTCLNGTCLFKLERLVDEFSGALDTSRWTAYASATTPAQQNGHLEITTVATSGGLAGLKSTRLYDATNSEGLVQLKSAGNQDLPSAQAIVHVRKDTQNRVTLFVQGHMLVAEKRVLGAQATVAAPLAYDAVAMRFLRIREAAGTTYWEYSADGSAFTVMASAPDPFPMGAVLMDLSGGADNPEAGTSTVIFDNVNAP